MTQSLQSVLKVAERERDNAAVALSQAERTLAQQQDLWQQFVGHRADYAARSPTQSGRSATIQLLRCHQDFMTRLDQALAHQSRVLEAAKAEAQRRREWLLACDTRLASVRKLLQRRHDAAARGAARHEQGRSDEAALQAHRLRSVATP